MKLKLEIPVFAKMLLVLLVLPFVLTNAGAQSRAKQLFSFAKSSIRAGADLSRPEKPSIAALREQVVDLKLTANEIKHIQVLNFPLFDGGSYKTVRDSEEGLVIRGEDDVTWRGKIESFPDSSVTLTFKGNILSGLIYAPAGVYEIIPQPFGKHVLVEIDQNLFPECANEKIAPENTGSEIIENSPAKLQIFDSSNLNAVNPTVTAAEPEAADSGDRIDVLMLYTPAVKNTLGGAAQVEAFLRQAVETGNTAYRNSRIRTRVRFVGAAELSYAESGSLQIDLTALRSNPTAAALRDQAKADLVGLIVNSGDGCGVGSQMSSISAAFAPRAYSVTVRNCAVGNMSFAHEMGHNMGLMHNPESATHTPAFPYALGHYFNGSFSTIMSYSSSCPQGCPRVPYFSNPYVFYNNQPTGIPDERDNARALNNTAETVANFRYSGSSLTLLAPNGGESWSRNLPRRVRWISDNLSGDVKIELSREGGEGYETLVAATVNDGEEVVSFKGRISRQARLRITSLSNVSISDSSAATFSIK